ncbi:alpha-1-antiproteinase-like [Hypanus sabinus]|uniref:alpha-1-antiproteinase-like n=1 Tax=Hypanus sabinus TaxID=79690 RepID=UPI0028C4C9D3|nr:alpha-1-antiproteinase-like [Hypanus sabinus]
MEKFLAFAFLLVALPSSGMVSGNPSGPSSSSISSSLLRLSAANSDFALRLYKQIASQSGTDSQNIFFSPLSISASLSMLSLGARENTLTQLLQVLGYSNITRNDAVRVGQIFHELLEHVSKLSDRLKTGNSLYVQEGREIHEKFIREAEELYKAKTETVDFREQQRTKDKINAYVSNETEGKIPNILSKSLSQDTVMLLLNYILFRGNWLRPFNTSRTYEADFRVDRRTTVKVPMMRRMGSYYRTYARDLSSDVLLMEYVENTSLLILLPRPGKLAEVERKLTIQKIYQLLSSLKKCYVEVHLPKMILKKDYQLKTLLNSMGIRDAFTSDANFSGLSKWPVKLSEVIQRSMLKIDERGSTASSSTETEITVQSAIPKIKINRPFLLLIADNQLKSVLFAGRVANPTA